MTQTGMSVRMDELLGTLSSAERGAYFPYAYAGLRRGFGAYRREFNKGSTGRAKLKAGRKGLKIRTPGSAGPKYGLYWRNHPKNEQKGRLEDIRVEFFTTSKAALALEKGATIRPTKGRRVAIPIGFALTPKGNVKRNFLSPDRARAAGYQLIFVPRRRGRGPFLAVDTNARRRRARSTAVKPGRRRRGRKRQPNIQVVFSLVPSVRIRPQLGFFAGWEKFAPQRHKRIVLEWERFLREHFAQPKKVAR